MDRESYNKYWVEKWKGITESLREDNHRLREDLGDIRERSKRALRILPRSTAGHRKDSWVCFCQNCNPPEYLYCLNCGLDKVVREDK